MNTPDAQKGHVSALKPAIRSLAGLVDLLMPPACRLCGEPIDSGKDFCHQCLLTLTLSETKMSTACQRCGRPGALSRLNLPANPKIAAASESIADPKPPTSGEPISACAFCHKEKFAFQRVIARWTYEGRVRDAIVAAKHASQSSLGSSLGYLLGQRVAPAVADDPPDCVTFVPSSFGRQLLRGGVNGNLTIAESVAKCLRQSHPNGNRAEPRVKTILRITRGIKKQAWLSDTQRRENVAGAFAIKKGYAANGKSNGASKLKSQHVLVVDDVLTTGATANEVSRVLLESGVRRVTLAVVARAVWSKN